MSKKYSKTTADYLTWDQNLNLIRKLYDDREYKLSLLIAAGSFWGLRISDILKLKWNDILNKDVFVLVETKTQKSREIRINAQLKKHINECYNHIKPSSNERQFSLVRKTQFILSNGLTKSLNPLNPDIIYVSVTFQLIPCERHLGEKCFRKLVQMRKLQSCV